MKELLNDYQFSSLLLTLRSFEEYLRHADEWLSGKTECGILYQRELKLSPRKRKARKQIADVLEQIADMVQKFGLQSVEENAAGLIRGQLTVSWADLMDTRSQKLMRYGEVNPRLPEVLDPSIDRLAQAALALTKLFDGTEMS